jgi:hypothetical protein
VCCLEAKSLRAVHLNMQSLRHQIRYFPSSSLRSAHTLRHRGIHHAFCMKSLCKSCANFLPSVILATDDEDAAVDASFWFLLFQCQVKDLKNEWRDVFDVDLGFLRIEILYCEELRVDLRC